MFRFTRSMLSCGVLLGCALASAGCATFGCGNTCQSDCQMGGCDVGGCDSCEGKSHKFWKKDDGCDVGSCDSCQGSGHKFWKKDKGDHDSCESCEGKKKWGKCSGCGSFSSCRGGICGACTNRSLAIQEQYPVGAVERAHFHQMQTNAEAADFVLFQKDFVLDSAELTPDGKDKVLEIAARMRSAPFPVVIERTYHNADPELDAHRRAIVAQVLTDLGNPDANNRTFVALAYSPGKQSLEGAPEYYQHIFQGNNNNNGNNNGFGGGGLGGGGGGGFGGGFGGGGFGGGGLFGF
jgi:hypothetical protein